MQLIKIFVLIIILIFSQAAAMADTPAVPYGVWSGTIGKAQVQVFFDEYDSNYYYIKHKTPIRLERSEKNPSEWEENVGHWEPKITGIWKLEQVSGNSIKGVWINPDTKEKLPIELKRIAAIVKDKNGYVDMSAFYVPIIDSLAYRYGTAKTGETRSIETDSGISFEVSTKMKNAQKLNKYAMEWLKEQAVASYDCQLNGGGGWQRSLTPQFMLGNFLIIEDNLPSTFCGGAHDTWGHSHIVYDLDKGDFVDTRSWIKDFEKTSYGDNDGKTKLRELIEKINPRNEEDCGDYFSLNAPYPTKEGLVFFASHPYVSRACDEDILVPYKELEPYLTPAGKKAVISLMPGLTFAPSLTDAVSDGDIDKVRSLIAAGANVNTKDIYDMTALEIAISKGYTDIAKLLVSKGADVNAKDKNGDTLLNSALKKGSVKAAHFLIEQGADVNMPDSEGTVPLTIALSDKKLIALAALIISKGADIDIKKKDEDGYSILYTVLFYENSYDDKYKAMRALSTRERLDIAKALIAKGADVNEKDLDGDSLLHIAVSKGNIEIITFLLENKADVNLKNNYFDGETALFIAIKEKKSIDIIKLLIAKGSDVNTSGGQYGYTLLSVALGHPEHISVMQLLIKNGADVNLPNGDHAPLHIAAGDGLNDAVELLIKNGANINTLDDDGATPLQWAVNRKHIDTVRLLIDKGADINIITTKGLKDTSLHNAIYREAYDIAKLLIEKGASIEIKDSNGDTPLQWAVYKGNMEITELLLKKGVDINTKDNHGETPLHTALREKHADIAKFLIEKGSDINAKDKYGVAPLQYAALNGLTDIVGLLIDRGADVNVKTNDGATALHAAVFNGSTDVVKLLIAKKANVNARANGETPLSLAIKNKRAECAAIIKAAGGIE